MKIGIIGLGKSGKTTIFNALTELNADTNSYSNKNKPNLGVVKVLDERVTKLSEMYNPKKTTYADIEIMDFAGISGENQGESFPPKILSLIKTSDALAWVVRNFADDFNGEPTVENDIETIKSELLLSDLIIAENRQQNIAKTLKKGAAKNIKELEIEQKAINKIVEQLNNGEFIKDLELSESEETAVRGYQFLTKKQFMVVLNSDENTFGNNSNLISSMEKDYDIIEFAGEFEAELSHLDEDEVEMFMEDMGIEESAKSRLTKFAYSLLGYISYFTVGEDEVRAWTITKGADAVKAAGAIHSDLAKGFIRAECFNYDDLIEFGSEKEIKSNGKFRLEGKDYIVEDGDILAIRFNV